MISDNGIVSRPKSTSQIVTLAARLESGNEINQFNLKVIREYPENNYVDAGLSELKELNGGVAPDTYVDSNNIVTFIDGKYTEAIIECPYDAIMSLNAVKTLFHINKPDEEFIYSSVDCTEILNNYRLQQIYKGIKVYGNEMVVTTDLSGRALDAGGDYTYDLDIDVTPTVNIETAKTMAKQYYEGNYDVTDSELVIYTDIETPCLVWDITVEGFDIEGNSICEKIFVNAKNGTIIDTESLINEDYNHYAEGYTYYSGKEKEKFRVFHTTLGVFQMFDLKRNLHIGDSENTTKSQFINVITSKTIDGFNDRIANSAIVNLDKTYDYYYQVLDRKSFNDKGGAISAYVHFTENEDGSGWNNAASFSNKGKFVFGDGDGINCNPRAAALDVVGHEYTHAVVATTCKLKNSGTPALINEAFADVMGAFVEGASGDAFWQAGDSVWRVESGKECTRSMKDPESEGGPRAYEDDNWNSNYKDNEQGIHSNSTVISHIAYVLYDEKDFTKTKIRQLFYNTMLQLKRKSDLITVRSRMLAVAKNLKCTDEEIGDIEDAFYQANISPRISAAGEKIYFEELELNDDSDTYNVSGRVFGSDGDNDDSNNKKIANAKVTILDNEMVEIASALTDSNGNYSIGDISFGNYNIKFEKEGYQTYDVTEEVSENISIDANLSLNDTKSNNNLLICMEISVGMQEDDYLRQKDTIVKITNNMSDSDKVFLCTYYEYSVDFIPNALTKCELLQTVDEITANAIDQPNIQEIDLDSILSNISSFMTHSRESNQNNISQIMFLSSGLVSPIHSDDEYDFITDMTKAGEKFNILKIGDWEDNGYLEYLTSLDYNTGIFYDVKLVNDMPIDIFFQVNDDASQESYESTDENSLILTYNCYDTTLKAFSVISADSYIIDWGDGKVTKNEMVHVYEMPGEHTIKVSFSNLEKISFLDRKSLVKVEGKLNGLSNKFTSVKSLFYKCTALQSVSDTIFNDCTEVTDFSKCFSYSNINTVPDALFYNCIKAINFSNCFSYTKLMIIPDMLFVNCTEVKDFSYCFDNTDLNTTIPDELFVNCTEVKDFSYCFNSNNLNTIPDELFINCTKVIDFSNCFSGSFNIVEIPSGLFSSNNEVINFEKCFASCYDLTNVPEGLFSNCYKAENFRECFDYCTSLKYMPVTLFDNCPNISDFYQCFNNCHSLVCLAPELWNRANVTSYKYCFWNCKKLLNYNNIPVEWK